jgi:hypothetical protein
MDEIIRASLLREFSVRQAEVEDPEAVKQWHWTPGTILFPEGICPWCNQTMTSSFIWVVRGPVLKSIVRVENGRLLPAVRRHPHIDGSSGAICMGQDGHDPIAALFSNMFPDGAYGSWTPAQPGARLLWKEWLNEYWSHSCDSLQADGCRLEDGTRRKVPIPCDHHCVVCCREMRCRINWRDGVRGCLCGCYCHPADFGPGDYCSCGHHSRQENPCECPQNPRHVRRPESRLDVTQECGCQLYCCEECDNAGRSERGCNDDGCRSCYSCDCGDHHCEDCCQEDCGCREYCCGNCEGLGYEPNTTCGDVECETCTLVTAGN